MNGVQRVAGWILGLVLAFGAFPGAVTPASAQEQYGDVTITVLPSQPLGRLHGYQEVRLRLDNRGDRNHSILLTLPGDTMRHPQGTYLQGVERTVELPARTAAEVSLPLPALPAWGRGIGVEIDGAVRSPDLRWQSRHPDPWRHRFIRGRVGGASAPPAPRVLLAQPLGEDDLPGPREDDEFRLYVSPLPIDQWSRQWLAYGGWDGIVMGWEQASSLRREVGDALWRYVEAGGTLWLVGTPVDLPVRGLSFAGRPLTLESRSGVVTPLATHFAGFGVIHLGPFPSLDPGDMDGVVESWRRSLGPWSIALNAGMAQNAMPVVDSVEIPVRGVFLLIVLFTLLVGPLNLVVLARRRQRLWIFATVPAISLVTCLAVFAYVVFDEGFIRQHRSAGLTLLDQVEQRATTLAWSGFYSTVTLGELTFDSATEVTPFAQREGKGAPRSMRLDAGQVLTGGWVSARVPSYLILRKSEDRRERLEVSLDEFSVLNGLGADILRLWVVDEGGEIYLARNILAGARQGLTALGARAKGGLDAQRQLYQGDLPTRLRRLEGSPEEYLVPGTYLAAVVGNPFLEKGAAVDTGVEEFLVLGRWMDAGGATP